MYLQDHQQVLSPKISQQNHGETAPVLASSQLLRGGREDCLLEALWFQITSQPRELPGPAKKVLRQCPTGKSCISFLDLHGGKCIFFIAAECWSMLLRVKEQHTLTLFIQGIQSQMRSLSSQRAKAMPTGTSTFVPALHTGR